MMWYGNGPHMMWGFGWMGLIMWFVFLILVVGIAIALWRTIGGGRAGSVREDAPARESALEVAQRRYARGEISRAEYEEIRTVLAEAGAASKKVGDAPKPPEPPR